MTIECEQCGREFDSERGLGAHVSQTHDKDRPWTEEQRLREMYHEKQMTQSEIAEKLGTTISVISEWMKRHAISTRDRSEAKLSQRPDQPWRDVETLEELYHGKEMSLREIADELGANNTIIARWMDRFDIERRSRLEATRSVTASFYTDTRGYEKWSYHEGTTKKLAVHRLLAIAAGADPHDVFSGQYHVHHINEIPWDNRPDNIEVLTVSEHRSLHAKKRIEDPNDEF